MTNYCQILQPGSSPPYTGIQSIITEVHIQLLHIECVFYWLLIKHSS